MDITTLILEADIIIKFILIFLLFFSVVSWAIFISKYLLLKTCEKESDTFYEKFINNLNMDEAFVDAQVYDKGFLPSTYIAGYSELKELCKNVFDKESLDNIQRAMVAKKDQIIENLNLKVSFLATVGSSSPFIGLLGTVWGIMNSFRELSVTQSNTLNAVAPGIAEALITTAVGLFAAIPAVIFYNKIRSMIEKTEQRSNSFIYEFINITYKIFLQQEAKEAKGKD